MSHQELLDDLDHWGMVQPRAAKAIRALESKCAHLRAAANWAAGRLLDAGDVEGHDKVLEMLSKEPT